MKRMVNYIDGIESWNPIIIINDNDVAFAKISCDKDGHLRYDCSFPLFMGDREKLNEAVKRFEKNVEVYVCGRCVCIACSKSKYNKESNYKFI